MQLLQRVEEQILLQRNPYVSGLLNLLDNNLSYVDHPSLSIPDRNELLLWGATFFKRLFITSEYDTFQRYDVVQSSSESVKKSKKEQLKDYIVLKKHPEKYQQITFDSTVEEIKEYIREDLLLQQEEKASSKTLGQLKNALSSIQPTSVDSKRAFSTLNLFASNLDHLFLITA